MASVVQTNFRIRKNLGKIRQIIEIPNLIDIQKTSYDKFLQADVPPKERKQVGLEAVFRSVFPIRDFNGTSELAFVSYNLEKPKYDVDECRQRGMTYAAPVKVTTQLLIYDTLDNGEKLVRDIKEQEVYFGELPLMTENGTFIINGTERVVVSQLHRSPGVFFDHDKGKTHSSGKLLYSARIIPYRGSWLDFEFDPKDIIYVRIDRRRKMHATVLLRALGYSTQELLNYFYSTETVKVEDDGVFYKMLDFDLLLGQRSTRDIRIDDKVVVKKNAKFNKLAIKRLQKANVDRLPFDPAEFLTKVAAHDVINMETGEVILECNDTIADAQVPDPDDPQKTVRLGDLCAGTAKKPADPEQVAETVAYFNSYLREASVTEFKILFIDGLNVGSYLRDTLIADKMRTTEESILEIYRRLRPGDPPTQDTAKNLFNNLFFNPDRYDLSMVGRLKLNYKFYNDLPEDQRPPLTQTTLTPEDILETVRHLIELKNRKGSVDDIDHLGNRRVRAVGELMENQYRIGLVRMERAIKERMNMSQEIDTLMPHDLINAKPVSAVVKEYFGSSQLSQFMDQTNPLSEVTHKRRLSALGPGGLTRERAGFEVRDVHATHYGRICPIETPEGPNIGLIASLSTYARVNPFGFVETPYRVVKDGRVTDEVVWLSALEEEGKYIAQATADLDENGHFNSSIVSARYNGDFKMVDSSKVQFMDVAPNQMVSVAAALVPFLEHDDANRALMGANMQRQAVPLLRTDAPLVGTGMEKRLAMDSGVCVIAQRDGVVQSVDASRIVVRAKSEDGEYADIYHLMKYHRSNQSTCYNQKPVVRTGDIVKKGDVLADGPAVDMGELALGRNVLVAFMPWEGYNFEDAILISERVVKDDIFTSVHIEEFESVARDTKLGKEQITRDIPNVGEDALKDLDESGIVRIGAEIRSGDILVGKITPKGETQLSPEEKLLRAIFGEKAGDVRDSSLRVPPGVTGTVISARVFARRGTEKDARSQQIEDEERARLERTLNEELQVLRESAYRRARRLLIGTTSEGKLVDDNGAVLLSAGTEITAEVLDKIPRKYWKDIPSEKAPEVQKQLDEFAEVKKLKEEQFHERVERLSRGDELPPGVIKMVKVYVAIKRKLQVGDKMAGRHGNKGVVSRILPEEDLPYLSDGRPVDIVLNPLGVPSRMNVGQILETHLGWGARVLGEQLQDMIDKNFSADAIRKRLLQIYEGKEAYIDLINSLDDEDVKRLAMKLKRGIFFATPVFDGATEDEIKHTLSLAGLPERGQTVLYDGRTGEAFDNDVTVGVMYVLKLHHLVDDKIHARSIGPYSLVTQQPLGGKAQFGGQRLGEMEVWAVEAYGAAYALQEFLTVKSDDVNGRTRMYESIVKGEFKLEAGLPESFNVLIKELQSLCLNVELIESGTERSMSGRSAAE